MITAIEIARTPAAQALAWTLVHFAWQGAVVGLVAAAALRVWRPSDASTRYAIGVVALGAMLAAPVVTFTVILAGSPPAAVAHPTAPATSRSLAMVTGELMWESPESPASVRVLMPAPPARPTSAQAWQPVLLMLILAGWSIGVAALSIRFLGGWLVARRVARHGVEPAPAAVARIGQAVARRLAVARRVSLTVSRSVTVPTLVGWIRPVVVLPMSVLAELSPAQVEAILAHELAHVRRHDYAVNLLQVCIETLLFYHPCVWWVSAEVRIEREHCCDDLAVEACGDRLVYVSALADLAASAATQTLALAATDGSLLARVRRLLGQPGRERHAAPIWAPLAVVSLVMAVAVAVSLTASSPADAEAAETAAQANPHVAAVAAEPPSSSAPPAVLASSDRVGEPVLADGWFQPRPAPPAPPRAPEAPRPPAPGLEPLLEAPPVPPLPPDPADPQDPADPPDAPDVDIERGRGNMTWSTATDRLQLSWTGPFRPSADERDLVLEGTGTTVTLSEGRDHETTMTFRRAADGTVTRTFRRDGRERPIDDDARAWLAGALRKAITHSGMFADERVARLLAVGGADAVFAEIDRFGSDASHAKRRYYEALVKRADLTPALVMRVLDRMPKDLTSDFELGRGLAAVVARRDLTDRQRVQAVRAAGAIESDFEQRRVLAAALASGPLTPELVSGVLDQARALESDFERGRLLRDLIERRGVTAQTSAAFIGLASQIESSFERARVLRALAGETDLAPPAIADAVRAASRIESSFERRRALAAFLARDDADADTAVAVLAAGGGDGGHEDARLLLLLVEKGALSPATAGAFFDAASRVTSGHERARVLTAALGDGAAPGFVVSGVLAAAAHLPGDHERSALLVRVARGQVLDADQRALYVAAAESIGSRTESDRAVAALVRATRR